jgi:hypothetical protein
VFCSVETMEGNLSLPVEFRILAGYKNRLYPTGNTIVRFYTHSLHRDFTRISPVIKSLIKEVKSRLYTHYTGSITTINIYKYKEELV